MSSHNTIVQAIVSMARALELEVVAEGIETEKQLEIVSRQGCHSAQGYLFHEPITGQEVEALLAQMEALEGAESRPIGRSATSRSSEGYNSGNDPP